MTVQDLVSTLGEHVPASAILVDKELKVLAYSQQADNADDCRIRAILSRSCSAETRTWFTKSGYSRTRQPFQLDAVPALGMGARWCLPTTSPDGEVNGYLFLAPHPGVEIDLVDPKAAESYTGSIGWELAVSGHHRSVATLSLERLLDGSTDDWHGVAEDLQRAGVVDPSQPMAVLAADSAARFDRPDVHVLRHDGRTLVVTNLPTDRARVVDLARDLTRRGGLAGIGGTTSSVAGLRESAEQARLSLRVATVDEAFAPVAHWAQLGMYQLAARPEALDDAQVREPARRLLEHRNPDLWQTALWYLEHAGDVSTTAAHLQIHRQTMYYRLTRISEISGLDLANGSDRLMLHLGLKIGRVLHA